MNTTRASRVGKRIGSMLSTAASIATGYVWAKHGLLYGFAIWAGFLIVCLAIYGACKFPWGETS